MQHSLKVVSSGYFSPEDVSKIRRQTPLLEDMLYVLLGIDGRFVEYDEVRKILFSGFGCISIAFTVR